jgi:hypothetical protein
MPIGQLKESLMGWSEGRDVGNLIEGSERLTKIFGFWPSFHDAEVFEINLWRGDVEPERQSYVFPVLMAKIHLWELTDEIDDKGLYVTRHHTMATLRFHDVSGLELTGFNHQNAIFGLAITREERTEGPSPVFSVKFEEAFGVNAEFICTRIEVVEAVVCDRRDTPT